MSDLVVLVPTKGRPRSLLPLAHRFEAVTPSHRVLFICDHGDYASRQAAADAGEVLICDGTYPQKVNAGVRHTDEPYVLVGADDIRPHRDWFEAAVEMMSDEVGFVSLNDLGNEAVMAGEYATLPLVARWYAELDQELYHEGYQHNGADKDASLRARERGAFAYAPDAVMEHLHPDWGKGKVDATYREGGMNRRKRLADRELLRQRWG